jgi:hypothetical protein
VVPRDRTSSRSPWVSRTRPEDVAEVGEVNKPNAKDLRKRQVQPLYDHKRYPLQFIRVAVPLGHAQEAWR